MVWRRRAIKSSAARPANSAAGGSPTAAMCPIAAAAWAARSRRNAPPRSRALAGRCCPGLTARAPNPYIVGERRVGIVDRLILATMQRSSCDNAAHALPAPDLSDFVRRHGQGRSGQRYQQSDQRERTHASLRRLQRRFRRRLGTPTRKRRSDNDSAPPTSSPPRRPDQHHQRLVMEPIAIEPSGFVSPSDK